MTISTGINAISTETISLIPVSDTIFISNRLANISNNIVFRPRAMNTVAFGVNFLIDIIKKKKKQSSLYQYIDTTCARKQILGPYHLKHHIIVINFK